MITPILSLIIALTPCENFVQKMATTNNVIDAKLRIAMARKHLSREEMDKGILVLLNRIYDYQFRTDGLYLTEHEKEAMTRFLFRIARSK